MLPIIWIAQIWGGRSSGLYRGKWIFGSFEEVAAVARTVATATAVLIFADALHAENRPVPFVAAIAAGVIAFPAPGRTPLRLAAGAGAPLPLAGDGAYPRAPVRRRFRRHPGRARDAARRSKPLSPRRLPRRRPRQARPHDHGCARGRRARVAAGRGREVRRRGDARVGAERRRPARPRADRPHRAARARGARAPVGARVARRAGRGHRHPPAERARLPRPAPGGNRPTGDRGLPRGSRGRSSPARAARSAPSCAARSLPSGPPS